MSVRVANRQTPILIIGETGTGKELLTRAIHENSAARNGSFTKINCGLLRSGSAKLSFQDPQPAGPATLYLDEITELPPDLQVELTHLLRQSESDGTDRTEDRDRMAVRVIASTSMQGNLVSQAKLRPDLYYRLSIVPLHLPPLRERKSDLVELVDFLLHRLAKRHNIPPTPIPPAVHERLARYDWPGNVRELENVIERMLLLAADFEFPEQDVTTDLVQSRDRVLRPTSQELPENGLSLAGLERDLLVAALAKFSGNQTKAARYLNISRRTLIYRMGKYKLRALNGVEHD